MPLSIGATEIPICLIPAEIRPALASEVSNLYGDSLDASFRDWLAEESPLLVVWITGFKPRGDDSRPDRGLVPLARMLFGDEIQILSVVSGPAKLEMWKLLKENPDQLITQNGLWEAILNLSDAVLADSVTLEPRPLTQLLISTQIPSRKSIRFPIASPVTTFTEHDVDSTLHLLFSHNSEVIFEGMCNPPGGDWSGLSIYDFQTDDEYRWTSLHRVSAIGGKRPDHLIQFADDNHGLILLPIESKDSPSKLGHSLGKALTRYIQELLNSPPIAFRKKMLSGLYGKGKS